MRTLLICHENAELTHQAMGRWLASFSDLAGIVVIREGPYRLYRRVRREVERVGVPRFLDVLAFRLYSKLFLDRTDAAWEREKLREIMGRYSPIPINTPILLTGCPNSAQVREFIAEARPDIMVARCKTLLKKEIYSLPIRGTWVMHPGICPEYRNAYGCFWALVNDQPEKVGMTLLRIDDGIDTGPVYGYYSYGFDEINESPVMIHHRVVLENLDILKDKLVAIHCGTAHPIDITGRTSAIWGQPWLSSYLKWKRRARWRQR